MVTTIGINLILLIYDDGTALCSVDDIFLLVAVTFLVTMLLPIVILGDLVFMPIEILVFILRKYSEKKYFKKKYTIKDFILEIREM